MFPWLAGQGLLALLLACLALYYLVLYPESNCYGSNAGGDCTLLLWHSVIMVLSLMLLIYYIYVVSDFAGQLKARRERDEATLDQLYTIERQEKRDKKQQEQQQAVEWQQQILSESDISRANPAHPSAAEQGPILNERGLLQQFAQPSYLPDVPLQVQSAVPPGAMFYPHHGDPAAATPQFIHPVQILQVDPDGGGAVRSQMPQRQQQHDGYRLLSVLPAAAHSSDGKERPHYENQSGHQLSEVQGLGGKQPHPVPPPRPLKRRPPPSLEADSDAAAKGHYENAGYLRDAAAAAPATDESPSQREVVSPAAADSKETETTGTTTAESAETTRSDQSASDEKRKKSLKRVRILE